MLHWLYWLYWLFFMPRDLSGASDGGVTGHFKTSRERSNQNRPLGGALFITGFLTQAGGFSITSYALAHLSSLTPPPGSV